MDGYDDLPKASANNAPSSSNDGYGDLPKKTSKKTPTTKDLSFSYVLEEAANRASAAGRGVVKTAIGGPGELERFALDTVPKFLGMKEKTSKRDMGFGRETLFPTTEEVENVLQVGEKAIGRKPGVDPRYKEYETFGEYALPAVQLAPLATKLVTKGGEKIGELLGIKRPELDIKPSTFREMGEKIGTSLESKVNKQFAEKSAEATNNYDAAISAAREAQVKGIPFAQSPQGKAFIDALEKSKTFTKDGQVFEMGEEQIKGINRLIDAVKGSTYGGEVSPLGKGLVSSKQTTKAPSVTQEKDIKALIEELRYLRESNAKGKPAEAYGALSDQYKKDLAKTLENYLYDWNPAYKKADEAYKAASEKLNVFKTELMSRVLRGEKFDFKQMAADPESFAKEFFKTQDTVKQLKSATGDSAAVDNLAKEYAATVLQNKTPEEIYKFATNPNNEGWLFETGLKDKLIDYANKATKVESKQKILKWLGYGAAAGATGGAVTKYDFNRMFGGY